MAKFVYLYSGGAVPETTEAQEQSMQQWIAWFGTLGAAVVDGGNPFGASSTVTVDGANGSGTSGVNGYSVVEAGSLDEATTLAAGCPILRESGTVEVHEALAM